MVTLEEERDIKLAKSIAKEVSNKLNKKKNKRDAKLTKLIQASK